ncbi:MAG: DNA repair protein RecO [Candidatus Omnitrophica bacterium]|nr:DNA repair protein RecO [Candidatus Omnitrophota bacterium]
MSIHKTEAIVLDRKDYRETSYLISLLTRDFGKIYAQAKGAKRKAGKFGTNFSPISYNKIVFYENDKSGFHIISQADLIDHFNAIDTDIERFTYATYFLELVSAAMPQGEKNPQVFELVKKFLNFLNKQYKILNIAQIFEIKFLNLSGFKPRLDNCVSCGSQVLKESKFSFVLGGLLCMQCFARDHSAHKVLQGTIATVNYIENNELEKIANLRIIESVRKELQYMLRRFIDFHVGEQFNSIKFMGKMKTAYV